MKNGRKGAFADHGLLSPGATSFIVFAATLLGAMAR